MASRCSCEYRTLKRNFSIVVESLSDTVNPTHFAQKLSEVNLVSKDVVASANVMSIPPAQRIQPVITAVHAQIKLRASLYHKFIGVVQRFNPPLAEVLGKFHDMLGIMSGITDLKPLGHELELDPVKLNELQQGGGGPGQCAEELLVLWQEKDGDPSWEKLARALKRMGEHEMSRKMVEKHIHNHRDDGAVPGDSPVSVAEAQEEQNRLQGKFEALIHTTRDVLKEKQVDVSQLCLTISILPLMIKGDHKKFLLENLPQLCKAHNLDETLCLLNVYMDYLNYSLLEHIITKHGDTALKQMMVEYVGDLQSFRRRIPLHVFWEIQPMHYTVIPPDFKSLVLKHGKATPTSTLEDVECFRQKFARQYSLSDITLMVASIASGSVVITWLIPSSIVDEVKKEITDGNADFFRENEVTQVTVDGSTLYEEPQSASAAISDSVEGTANPKVKQYTLAPQTTTRHHQQGEGHDISTRFASMFESLVQMPQKQVNVHDVKAFLGTFGHPTTHQPYIDHQIYMECSTLQEVMKSLQPHYINPMHTYVLRKVVQAYGNDEAKQLLEGYDRNFPHSVPIKRLGNPLTDEEMADFPSAKRVKVVTNGDANHVTQRDIEEVQQALARSTGTDPAAIVFGKLSNESVAFIFMVPDSIVILFSELSTNQQKLYSLTLVGIIRIEVEGMVIDISHEVQLWEHRFERLSLLKRSHMGSTSSLESGYFSDEEEVPPEATTQDDERALSFAANLHANRTEPTAEFYKATISDRATAALSDGLSNNRSLRELELDDCKISSVGLAALATALFSNTFLKTICLRNCGITDDSMVELSQALLQNLTLEKLDLSNPYLHNHNTITHRGVTSLSEALLSNKSLKTLNLRGNRIADQGACSIAHALHGNDTLQSLNLGRNNISNQGATALAKLLETNRSIKILVLRWNRIADQGVCSIAEALHGNETLQSLDLSHNHMTDVGIRALSAALPINKSLRHLELSLSDVLGRQYHVTDEGVRQLLALGLEGSTSLKTLRLWETEHISPEAMKILRDSTQRRGIELEILPFQ